MKFHWRSSRLKTVKICIQTARTRCRMQMGRLQHIRICIQSTEISCGTNDVQTQAGPDRYPSVRNSWNETGTTSEACAYVPLKHCLKNHQSKAKLKQHRNNLHTSNKKKQFAIFGLQIAIKLEGWVGHVISFSAIVIVNYVNQCRSVE